jgi:hypothetical protein
MAEQNNKRAQVYNSEQLKITFEFDELIASNNGFPMT